MPAFSTGNTAWDQGLGNLSGALFPDPSKVAQAGYYGAEQRKAQLESSKIRDQMARQQVADQAANTLTMPATSYAPSPEGPNMPPIMQPPGSAAPPSLSAAVAPGSAAAAPPPPAPAAATPAAPTAAPPPSLSGLLAGNGGPAAPAPGPAAAPPTAPAAGTVGANMAPGGLSALFAGGGGAVPDGGGTIRLDQGTPPPVSSPAQGSGAPPAPNNTASDGSVPTNDAVSGIFHPGSITPPGGGRKTTGPADANGAPAKPMITAAQWVNMQVAAGHDANQALVTWRAMISSAYDTGQIDENTYHHMMGSADPSIITTDATNAANIKRTGMEQDGATTRAGMPTTFVADDPSDPTKGHYVPLSQQQGLGGTASFAPAATTTAAAPVMTQPVPGGPTFASTQGQAARSGTPLYQPTQETERGAADRQMAGINNAQVEVVSPTDPTKTVVTTFADAKARGLQLTPKGQDQFGAQVQSAIVNAKTPEARQQIIDASSAAAAANKPPDANEDYHRQQLFDNELTKAYPLPDKASYGTEMAVPGLAPDDENRIRNRADFLFNYSPDRSLHGNYSNAAARAIQEAKENGQLPTPEDLNAQRGQGGLRTIFGDVAGARPNVFTRTDLKGDQTDRFRIKTKAPATTDTNQTAPAGAIARAPAGAADGRKSINPPGVVRGGWVYPQ